jgi:phosphoserine aminotransferase
MARIYNFSAGPSMLPEKVLKTAQAELLDYQGSGQSVMEMSHRSRWFDAIITETEASIRRVLGVPDNYKLGFFQGGATQQFAMVPLNFMTTGKADYLVTGNFSKKAAEEAAKFGDAEIVASSKDKNFTYIPDVKAISYHKDASYVHICQNNTIFGTTFAEVPQVEGVPLVADMSSMIFSQPTDVSKYGCIYFGVQKNVAPAGMAIAIIREDLLGKSAKGIPAENIPTMMNYTTLLAKDSMYNTPPCWCIYMTGLVMQYLEHDIGGLAEMEKINRAKASVLYDYLDSQEFFKNPVEHAYRSMMNVTFTSPSAETDKEFCAAAEQAGFVNLKGHRLVGGMRASIYNAMPPKAIDELVAFMEKFRKAHV